MGMLLLSISLCSILVVVCLLAVRDKLDEILEELRHIRERMK